MTASNAPGSGKRWVAHAQLQSAAGEKRRQSRHDLVFERLPRRGGDNEVVGITDQVDAPIASFPQRGNDLAAVGAFGSEQPFHSIEGNVRQERRAGSTNAKDNFRFERMIVGWRERPVVDLRRKR